MAYSTSSMREMCGKETHFSENHKTDEVKDILERIRTLEDQSGEYWNETVEVKQNNGELNKEFDIKYYS